MPTIPLLRNGNSSQLPNLPNAVLDRERRPNADFSGVMRAAGQLAEANRQPNLPQALADPYTALGAIGSAIAQTGSILGGLAIKQQQARTDYQVAEADAEMDREYAAFQTWKIENNPDPATWAGAWEKRLGGLSQRLSTRENLTHGAGEAIKLRVTRFAGQSLASVATGAAKEEFSRAASSYKANIARAIESQDSGKFEELKGEYVNRGYGYDYEALQMEDAYKNTGERQKKEAAIETRRADLEFVESQIAQDPFLAKTILHDVDENGIPVMIPGMEPGDVLAYQHRADAEVGNRKREAKESLMNGIVTGALGETEIDTIQETNAFTPLEKAAIEEYKADVLRVKKANEPLDPKEMAAISLEIDEFDGRAFKTPEEGHAALIDLRRRANLATAAGGEDGESHRGWFSGRLYNKLSTLDPNQKAAAFNTPAGLKTEFTNILESYAREGAFGDAKDAAGNVNEKAYRRRAGMERALWNDLEAEAKANPNAFPDPDSVDVWLSQRLTGLKMGEAVKKHMRLDDGLFPADDEWPPGPGPGDQDSLYETDPEQIKKNAREYLLFQAE